MKTTIAIIWLLAAVSLHAQILPPRGGRANLTGTTDGAALGKRPGTEKFVDIIKKKGFTNLGTWAVRNMRGSDRLSVHATGRAADIGYKDKATAAMWAKWLVANYKVLGIEEVHDYSGITKKGCEKWGRGWRCFRKDLKGAGWLDWTATNNGGSAGGTWIHVEITPAMADDAAKFEAAWRSLPKPT
jgi:hypothetical protein